MSVRLPSYARVKLLIRQRISSGIWRAGEMLPPLAKLAELTEVSVGTVRRAVAELAAEGVLETHQGKGIAVVDYGKRYWNRFHRFQRRDGSLILEYEDRLVLFDVSPASDEIARQLQLMPGDPVIHWRREMNFDGRCSGFDESYLPQKFFPSLTRRVLLERPKNMSIYALYEKIGSALRRRCAEPLPTAPYADARAPSNLSASGRTDLRIPHRAGGRAVRAHCDLSAKNAISGIRRKCTFAVSWIWIENFLKKQ